MIWTSDNTHAPAFGLGAGLAQRGEEAASILIVPENVLALIPAIHDMIV
jgi:hypothetical protein